MVEAHPTTIDQDVDGPGNRRRLLAIDMPHDPDRRIVVVEVVCPSTGRRYLLRVPPVMTSCARAVAWTLGVDLGNEHELTLLGER